MRIASLIIPLVAVLQASGQPAPETAVIQVIDRFFAAMAARDTAAMAATLTNDGVFHAVLTEDPDRPPIAVTHQAYLASLANGEGDWRERYWHPVVYVDEGIATVTMRYDFHADGRHSHCGADVFTLVLDRGTWKIAGGVYTMRRMDCPDSPLGPLEGGR
ncbi:MAG: DUF4440 domain-containing protein [Flavobacteriales bacterium]|nr:DUF4440 domain-containing protein [Flavobacteriales bacterium]